VGRTLGSRERDVRIATFQFAVPRKVEMSLAGVRLGSFSQLETTLLYSAKNGGSVIYGVLLCQAMCYVLTGQRIAQVPRGRPEFDFPREAGVVESGAIGILNFESTNFAIQCV